MQQQGSGQLNTQCSLISSQFHTLIYPSTPSLTHTHTHIQPYHLFFLSYLLLSIFGFSFSLHTTSHISLPSLTTHHTCKQTHTHIHNTHTPFHFIALHGRQASKSIMKENVIYQYLKKTKNKKSFLRNFNAQFYLRKFLTFRHISITFKFLKI